MFPKTENQTTTVFKKKNLLQTKWKTLDKGLFSVVREGKVRNLGSHGWVSERGSRIPMNVAQ